MQTSDGAELSVVSDEEAEAGERAAAIKARREGLELSQSQVERESERFGKRINRTMIGEAERGVGSDAAYRRLNVFYDKFERENSASTAASAAADIEGGHPVTFTIERAPGVRATVQGPVSDFDRLQRIAHEMWLDVLRDTPDTPDED